MERSKRLNLKPKWERIENARMTSDQFLSQAGVSTEKVQAVTMVISELIENADYCYPPAMFLAAIFQDYRLYSSFVLILELCCFGKSGPA